MSKLVCYRVGVIVRKGLKFFHDHYRALLILAVAVSAIMWYLGVDEFRHSIAFLVFEHVLRHASLTAAEEA